MGLRKLKKKVVYVYEPDSGGESARKQRQSLEQPRNTEKGRFRGVSLHKRGKTEGDFGPAGLASGEGVS